MAYVHLPDPEVRRRKLGLKAGVAIAILATVIAYLAEWIDPYGSTRLGPVILLAFWVGPLVVAAVLACIAKTRSLAAGLALGLMVTWIVSVPTCVVVSVATIPNLLG